jgi:hypothetical protein
MWKARHQQLGAKQSGVRRGECKSRPGPIGARGGREGGGWGRRRRGWLDSGGSAAVRTKACPGGEMEAATGRAGPEEEARGASGALAMEGRVGGAPAAGERDTGGAVGPGGTPARPDGAPASRGRGGKGRRCSCAEGEGHRRGGKGWWGSCAEGEGRQVAATHRPLEKEPPWALESPAALRRPDGREQGRRGKRDRGEGKTHRRQRRGWRWRRLEKA